MTVTRIEQSAADTMELETLHVRQDGAVLFAQIAAPPMCSFWAHGNDTRAPDAVPK